MEVPPSMAIEDGEDPGLDLAASHLATTHITDNETHNTIRPKDFLIAHAFASLTTSSAFGEASVSFLTLAPDSLDKFLHLTDTGSCWCFCFAPFRYLRMVDRSRSRPRSSESAASLRR